MEQEAVWDLRRNSACKKWNNLTLFLGKIKTGNDVEFLVWNSSDSLSAAMTQTHMQK